MWPFMSTITSKAEGALAKKAAPQPKQGSTYSLCGGIRSLMIVAIFCFSALVGKNGFVNVRISSIGIY